MMIEYYCNGGDFEHTSFTFFIFYGNDYFFIKRRRLKMACGACQKRRQMQRGKIVPVVPGKKTEESKAQQQGDKLRDKLRYTGR